MSGVAIFALGGADIFGLTVGTVICVYLVYALVRGERF